MTLIVYTVSLFSCFQHLRAPLSKCVMYFSPKQGYGVTAWPIDLVRGRRNVTKELTDVAHERQLNQSKIEALRNKVSLVEMALWPTALLSFFNFYAHITVSWQSENVFPWPATPWGSPGPWWPPAETGPALGFSQQALDAILCQGVPSMQHTFWNSNAASHAAYLHLTTPIKVSCNDFFCAWSCVSELAAEPLY